MHNYLECFIFFLFIILEYLLDYFLYLVLSINTLDKLRGTDEFFKFHNFTLKSVGEDVLPTRSVD